MPTNTNDLIPHFRHTARALCRYDILKQSDILSHKKEKSSAQVAPLVRPQAVGQKAGALKRGRKSPHRLMARFSDAEKEVVQRKAKATRLSISEYIRASVLGAGYVATVDPARQKLLHDLSRELGRQGNNLNQIAKQMNASGQTQQAEGMLAEVFDSLITAHNDVRRAMAERKLYE